MAIVGEQFDVGEDLCGIVLSVRYQEDLIAVWNKSGKDQNMRTRIQ
jgi:translation initiation factor 4E